APAHLELVLVAADREAGQPDAVGPLSREGGEVAREAFHVAESAGAQARQQVATRLGLRLQADQLIGERAVASLSLLLRKESELRLLAFELPLRLRVERRQRTHPVACIAGNDERADCDEAESLRHRERREGLLLLAESLVVEVDLLAQCRSWRSDAPTRWNRRHCAAASNPCAGLTFSRSARSARSTAMS